MNPSRPPLFFSLLVAVAALCRCDTATPPLVPAAGRAEVAAATSTPASPPAVVHDAGALAVPAATPDGGDVAAHDAGRVRPAGAYANVDPDDDEVVAPPDPRPACDEELKAAGVSFRSASIPVHTEKHGLVCGAEQVVLYLRGPGKIAYEPAPVLTCGMALALASFEKIVQEEAESTMHSRVVKIRQLGTYSCREIAAYPGWVSEHSYANAIDVSRFWFKSGKVVDVVRDFDKGDETPARPGGVFFRNVSRRAYDEEVFSHVLTPFFNAQHNNHFHLDLARYRGDGTRPQT